jgi:hypothetical protein
VFVSKHPIVFVSKHPIVFVSKHPIAMDLFVPITSWKGWVGDLTSPLFSFEFCRQSLDRLKRVFPADMFCQAKFIAFPELAMPIRVRLLEIAIRSKNPQIAAEVNPLANFWQSSRPFWLT